MEDFKPSNSMKFDTLTVHGGKTPDATGAICPPIYQNTTFIQPSVERYMEKGFTYSRSGNPTVRCLEHKIAELEGGVDSCCFSSGMAAVVAAFHGFLNSGDHCIITNCSYGGTNRSARVYQKKFNVDFEFIDFRNLQDIENAIKPSTRLILSESPTNPTLFLADVQAISDICKRHNMQRSSKTDEVINGPLGWGVGNMIIHICDSTFATPLIMKPLELGVDLVLQSTTKFFDGHNITVGGCLISKNKELCDIIRFHQNVLGNIMSPQNAFYTIQTIKSLSLRVSRQCKTAQQVAEFLLKHPKVERVIYPGLENFEQRALALKQHKGGLNGGMLAFEVKGGTQSGIKLMNSIKSPWSLCENLGTCESIITCPAVFTHANMTKEDRAKVGITDGFIRVSVGIEDPEDLLNSLNQALEQV